MDHTIIYSNFEGPNYTSIINNGTHYIASDEPLEDGGHDKGLNPFELVLAGLASCTTATLKMYADRKGWQIAKIHIVISMEDAQTNHMIKRDITIDGDLNIEQKERLLKIAEKCPVHKLLSGFNQIETKIK